MVEYEKMYAVLCGAVDTALELIEQNSDTRQVAETLQVALNKAESCTLRDNEKKSADQKSALFFYSFSPHPSAAPTPSSQGEGRGCNTVG